ncbi:MAG: hypothetical protein MK100_01240 [Phycisphaerales bacterium]|nr:hypothetical protein [Phycisphaerales bacterium]
MIAVCAMTVLLLHTPPHTSHSDQPLRPLVPTSLAVGDSLGLEFTLPSCNTSRSTLVCTDDRISHWAD